MPEQNSPPVPLNPAPTQDPIAAVPPAAQFQAVASSAKKSNTTCLVLGVLGCFVVIPVLAILVVIVIVAINPVQRIKDQQAQQNQIYVNHVAQAIKTCIAAEQAKGKSQEMIYSLLTCASKSYLQNNSYIEAANIPSLEIVNINVNSADNKICLYTGTPPNQYVTWDTISGTIMSGQRTITCS